MKVKLPEKSVSNAEYVFTRERFKTSYGVISHQNAVKQAVKVEWYTEPSRVATVVYCNIWVGDDCSGEGGAAGGGQCKFSAAFSAALRSAGIELDEEVAGRGLRRVEEAIKAISLALYPTASDCIVLGL